MPGDPVAALITVRRDGQPSTPAEVAACAALHGLDAPLPVQYLLRPGAMLQEDPVKSFVQGHPVAAMITEAAGNALALTFVVVLAALMVALPLAVLCALQPNSLVDRALMLLSVAGMSGLIFWNASLPSLVFVLWLAWLPWSGFSVPLHLVPPALVAATGFPARNFRNLLLEESQPPHALAAIAQRDSSSSALLRHALPIFLTQILTALGAQIIHVFKGKLVIATIFN